MRVANRRRINPLAISVSKNTLIIPSLLAFVFGLSGVPGVNALLVITSTSMR